MHLLALLALTLAVTSHKINAFNPDFIKTGYSIHPIGNQEQTAGMTADGGYGDNAGSIFGISHKKRNIFGMSHHPMSMVKSLMDKPSMVKSSMDKSPMGQLLRGGDVTNQETNSLYDRESLEEALIKEIEGMEEKTEDLEDRVSDLLHPRNTVNCNAGWTEGPDGNCYQARKANLTFFEAQRSCEDEGSVLTTSKTPEINLFLTSLLKSKNLGKGWLNAKVDNEGVFRWQDDGEPLSYNNWAPGDPENLNPEGSNYYGNNDCAVIKDHGGRSWIWADGSCFALSVVGFVCKAPANCNAGWTEGPDGNCYQSRRENLNFFDAQRTCEDEGSVLTTSKTPKTNEFLSDLMRSNYICESWLNAMADDKGVFWWLDDGEPLSYNNWASGEPNMRYNYGSNACVIIKAHDGDRRSWTWAVDPSCSNFRRACAGFVCKAPGNVDHLPMDQLPPIDQLPTDTLPPMDQLTPMDQLPPMDPLPPMDNPKEGVWTGQDSSVFYDENNQLNSPMDNNVCPGVETSCGGDSCCPEPNAVCCSDKMHCCPHGYTCDLEAGFCLDGAEIMSTYPKTPAKKLNKSSSGKYDDYYIVY